MRERARRAGTRALRSVVGFAAERVAASPMIMSVVEDLMSESTFGGLDAHEEMLADRVRVDAYHRAIHEAVSPGDVVLDLGTGTGLLAMFAARAGASRVIAVEHGEVIELARELAEHNGIDVIEFVRATSRDVTLPEPVDVIVHEQMGDELLNENLVANLLDARDRLLRPGGRIVPSRFRLFVEPVSVRPEYRIRRFERIELPDGLDLAIASRSLTAARLDSGRFEQFWARPGSVEATVGQPSPVLELDLATLRSIDDLPTEHELVRVADGDVIVDGCAIWFEADLGEGAALTTSPLAPPTSWGNRVLRLDRDVAAGEELRLALSMPDLLDASTWTVTAR